MSRVPSILAITMLAALTASPAASEDANSPALIYSPWSKFCLRGHQIGDAQVCFIGRDARTECGPYLLAAVLIEQEGDTRKTLRVILAPQVKLEHGIRIAIDQRQAIVVPYKQCFAHGCMADYESDAGLITQLKTGQLLIVEAMDAANQAIRHSLPLADFAAAYDGPAAHPKAFDLSGREMPTDPIRTTPDCQAK